MQLLPQELKMATSKVFYSSYGVFTAIVWQILENAIWKEQAFATKESSDGKLLSLLVQPGSKIARLYYFVPWRQWLFIIPQKEIVLVLYEILNTKLKVGLIANNECPVLDRVLWMDERWRLVWWNSFRQKSNPVLFLEDHSGIVLHSISYEFPL